MAAEQEAGMFQTPRGEALLLPVSWRSHSAALQTPSGPRTLLTYAGRQQGKALACNGSNSVGTTGCSGFFVGPAQIEDGSVRETFPLGPVAARSGR